MKKWGYIALTIFSLATSETKADIFFSHSDSIFAFGKKDFKDLFPFRLEFKKGTYFTSPDSGGHALLSSLCAVSVDKDARHRTARSPFSDGAYREVAVDGIPMAISIVVSALAVRTIEFKTLVAEF